MSFIEKQSTENGCWVWIGARVGAVRPHPIYYGCIWNNGKNTRGHRASWEYFRGDIPKGMNVLHKCDNGLCVNPNHLFIGTAQDNTNDMYSKGRDNLKSRKLPLGSDNKSSKLSETQVYEILADNRRPSIIAMDYGVRRCTIERIKNGTRWKWIRNNKALKEMEEK